MRKDPPLTLKSFYEYIKKDHNQRQAMKVKSIETDSVVNVVTRNYQMKNKGTNEKGGNNLSCTHCGEMGHSKQRCYEIIGYPDWWDFTKKTQKEDWKGPSCGGNNSDP